jgi:hypothetical protein
LLPGIHRHAGYLKQLDLSEMPTAQRPDIHWLDDPTDDLKPIVFDTKNKASAAPRKDADPGQYCGGDSQHSR